VGFVLIPRRLRQPREGAAGGRHSTRKWRLMDDVTPVLDAEVDDADFSMGRRLDGCCMEAAL
jgi:hypothetical protein